MLSARNILLIGIGLLVIYKMLGRRENYQRRSYCIKKDYRELGREVFYMDCKAYGYIVPVKNPKAKPLKMYKCAIGVPADSMKYKIIIDNIARYTPLMEYDDMGVVAGSYLKFDNGKEYQVINNNSNVIL